MSEDVWYCGERGIWFPNCNACELAETCEIQEAREGEE